MNPTTPTVGYRKSQFLSGPILLGKKIELKIPTGEQRQGQFAIVELENIIASHNEKTYQNSIGYPLDKNGENVNDRNYTNDLNAQAKIIEFAKNLDPDRLIITSRTPAGTPIISVDGIVVSGNNRTMSIKLAVDEFPEKYQDYINFLKEEIDAFGFESLLVVGNDTYVVTDKNNVSVRFQYPVLVRIDYDFPDYNALELSKYNKDTKKSERPIDKAIKLGKILDSSEKCTRIISGIVSKYETFSEFYSNNSDQKLMKETLVNCNILTSQEMPSYFQENSFTEQGKELIENLLAGLILSKEALISSNEGGARLFRQTLITSLPVLTANLALGNDSLNNYLNEAVVMQAKMSASKLGFNDFISQTNIFDTAYDKKSLYVNRLLALGRNKFKSSIEAYNNSVEQNMGESLFGEKPTADEIFQAHIIAKIDPTVTALIEKNATVKQTSNFVELSTNQAPEQMEEIKRPMMENPFINQNYFKAFPDHILASQIATIDRWKKPIIEYKGDLNLDLIVAEMNFIGFTEPMQPTISVVTQSVFKTGNNNTEVVDNLKSAIKQNTIDQPKKKDRSQSRTTVTEKLADDLAVDTYSIREVFDMINPEVSIEELQAFLWYKANVGRPINNPQWIALSGLTESELYHSPENLESWIRAGHLFYYNGQLIPSYLYLAENVYDKKNKLVAADTTTTNSGQDKAYIIANYGQDVYDNQVAALNNVFKKQYDKRLVLSGEGAAEGLIISPISKFAKTHKIATLQDGLPFKWKKITAASNKLFGKPDFLAPDVRDRDKSEFTELSLTDAFCLWLRMDETIQIKKGMNYADIIKIYIQSKSKSATTAQPDENGQFTGAQLLIKKKEDAAWERAKAKAKEEGDRLFLIFLSTQLTLNDKVLIETEWNAQFNGYVPINYNKVPVAFRCNRFDMGKPMEIKPEKREAVAFTFSEGSGLLAYDVGVGKTPSAVFTICQFLDTGYSKRPVLVVPNQTYKQWISEFKKFAGHITVNDFYNLSADYINDWKDMQGKTKMVPEGSVSLITYEGMKQLGFNQTTLDEISPEIGAILLQKSDEKASDKKRDREAEKLNSAVEEIIGRALSRTVINVEDLGFDFICMDEAHACKKVFTNVKGEKEENLGNSGKDSRSVVRYEIKSGAPSFNGVKGFMLCHYFQKKFSGNTLLLTATPFTNSPLEVYSMLAMVAFNKLKEMQLDNLSTFFDTFVAISYEMIINSRLKPERRQVIMGFNNLISLQTLVRRFINYKTGEEVKVPRPNKIVLPLRNKMIDGLLTVLPESERVETILPLTALQSTLMESIKNYADGNITEAAMCALSLEATDENEDAARAEGVELDEDALDENEKIGVRLLKAMNHARNLALSPYIFDCSGLGKPDAVSFIETSNKLLFTMECIKTIKEYHAAEKTDMSGVVIYSDRGVQYFPLIRQYLIEQLGFGENEVGIISSKIMTPVPKGIQKEDQKEYLKNLFLGKKFNNANLEMEEISGQERMKVLIGSSTIKEGINLQSHSSCLFNLWIDWNPTDIQQLEGRIYRQGNKFKTVRIINPLMIDSMDIFMFQKLEEKTSRINTIWQNDGKTNVLKTEEFNPKDLKSSLIRDPRVLAQLELLEISEKMEEDIADLGNQIKRNQKIIGYTKSIEDYSQDLADFIEEYRPAEGRVRSLDANIGLAQEVFRKLTDSQGKVMAYTWQQSKSKPRDYYSKLTPPSKPYYLDELIFANRNLKREERDYLSPRGVTIKQLPKYSDKLLAEIESIRAEKERLAGDEALEIKVKEIIEYRILNKVEERSVAQVVKSFAKLNYLLSDIKFPDKKLDDTIKVPLLDANGKVRIDAEALAILDAELIKEPETKRMHTIEIRENDTIRYEYTPERLKLHEKILEQLTEASVCIEQGNPIVIFTGGAPGSGKSTFLKKYAPYMQSEQIYKIDADEVREYLPEYKGWNSASTHQETRDIVNKLLDTFDKPCKHDVLYDGTMSNGKKYIPLIKRFKELGYKVFIAYMDVPKAVSIERALKRFQDNSGGKTPFGRYVPLSIIEEFFVTGTAGFEDIKAAVDGYILIDSLTQKVIQRGGEEIPQDRDYKSMFNASENKQTTPIPTEKTKANIFNLDGITRFFHGSDQKRVGKLEPNDAQQFGTGVYFSTNKELAKNEFGPYVIEVELTINNPVYTTSKQWWDLVAVAIKMADEAYGEKNNLKLKEEQNYFRYDSEDISEIAEIPSRYISDAAKKLGYDAIIDKGGAYENEIAVLYKDKIIYVDEMPSELIGFKDIALGTKLYSTKKDYKQTYTLKNVEGFKMFIGDNDGQPLSDGGKILSEKTIRFAFFRDLDLPNPNQQNAISEIDEQIELLKETLPLLTGKTKKEVKENIALLIESLELLKSI
jgi:predicted ABC-type ATPase